MQGSFNIFLFTCLFTPGIYKKIKTIVISIVMYSEMSTVMSTVISTVISTVMSIVVSTIMFTVMSTVMFTVITRVMCPCQTEEDARQAECLPRRQ